MPVHVDWYDKSKTIMLLVFEGNWTIGELYDAMQQQTEFTEALGRKVDVIADLSSSGSPPSNMLSHFPGMAARAPKQVDRAVIVGVTSRFLHTAAGIFSKIYGKIDVKDTVAEAIVYLNETPKESNN